MSLNKGEVNPLGVLKLRRLKFIPAHFTTVRIGPLVDVKFLTQWINYNLNSRYGIKQSVMIDQDNKIKKQLLRVYIMLIWTSWSWKDFAWKIDS